MAGVQDNPVRKDWNTKTLHEICIKLHRERVAIQKINKMYETQYW